MSTFTTIVRSRPTFNVTGHSIESIAHDVKLDLLSASPRGAKAHVAYELMEKPAHVGQKFLVLKITVRGQQGGLLHEALIISEQPAVARKQGHANRSANEYITCRDCGYDQFYDLGRSLDYNHHECAHCGRGASTLTETGASA